MHTAQGLCLEWVCIFDKMALKKYGVPHHVFYYQGIVCIIQALHIEYRVFFTSEH